MQGLDGREGGDPPPLAPAQEVAHGAGIGAPGVRVADGGGEELQEAHLGALSARGDDRWQAGRLRQGDEPGHLLSRAPRSRAPWTTRTIRTSSSSSRNSSR